MEDMSAYEDFKKRFKLLAGKNQHLVVNTLSNIFTMRLIGNKTHGDLAEIGMVEFINQFMYDYKSTYVGKNKKFDFDSSNVIAGKGRAHPIFMFINACSQYICEVRYGGASAIA